MDVVADQLFNERKIHALTIVNNYSRECLGIGVDFALKGEDVVLALDKINCLTGRLSNRIMVDNGSEFILRVLDK